MKIIIMSDSHLKNETVMAIIAHYPDADCYIHCGDVGKPMDQAGIPNFYIVKGNNDYSDFPKELLLTIDHKQFFITHGDPYQVDLGLNELYHTAQQKQADYVLYGHTHHPNQQVINSITFINPGSVAFPRGGQIFVPCYCVLEDDTCHFFHAKTFENIDHLFEPKKRVSLFKRLFGK
ncbi:YfcE family phosphodiesterase [Beduini massiliensis]|uniref:YfcE family phosphodiesterase n=1 Tax=Beduini massiliensis TaxID=1585974 RepID=UPI00059A9EC0|nr:YfcE family phosphodiesterase [Beduini massiliensis]